MNNKIKFGIGIIAVIIIVVICVNTLNKDENSKIQENTSTNITNTEVENEIENTSVENVVEENTIVNETIAENQQLETEDFANNIYESNSDAGTTNKKEEAINLVKQQWGEDDTVTFSCDSITSDGIYIIAVTSKQRAEVLNYFRVDLNSKTVTVDY